MEYWFEALNSSLCEIGREDALTEDQKKAVALDLLVSHDNYSMAFAAPDFRAAKTEKSTEVRRLEGRVAELEARDLIFRQAVATRRRVPIEDVYIENGNVKYDITHQY